MSLTIRCRCVICKHTQNVDPIKVDALGPSCEKCFGPMVVEHAEVRMPKTRARRRGITSSAEPT